MVAESADRLRCARAAIARACLDALPPEQLGDICLRPAQRRIVARAAYALDTHGGCLIAEDVGRGKTFIALALARRWRAPLVVVPAGLRSAWEAAQLRAHTEFRVISHESLSRGRSPVASYDAIIVDEAHHFRNPVTARYAALAHVASAVPIVLLSATPIQNRERDLAAQVALFFGEGAFALRAEQLSRFVIRGDDTTPDDMPAVAPPEWLHPDVNDGDVLAAILDLPSPASPVDGGDAGALRTMGLVRAWASSRAALVATLRSRRRLSTAIAQGVEAGLAPTRREALAWHAAEDAIQLGLAAILMQGNAHASILGAVRLQLDADAVASDHLRAMMAAGTDPDVARVDMIRSLRARHPGQRIVAFSEYASTIAAFFARLRSDAGVGMLTSHGARIASGRIARDDLLGRFAPRAQRVTPAEQHQSVTLLLTTDILSEGVNLQDASIVLHLDLPWNPARLAQRVGRVRRPGGAKVVRTYLLAPPAHADALLTADARLRRKLEQARLVVGIGFDVLPSLSSTSPQVMRDVQTMDSRATVTGALIETLQRWQSEDGREQGRRCDDDSGLTGALTSDDLRIAVQAFRELRVGAAVYHQRGWLAALDDGRLVGSLQHAPSELVTQVAPLVSAAAGEPRLPDDVEVWAAVTMLDRWLSQQELLATCGLSEQPGPIRRAVLSHLASIIRRTPRHAHARVLSVVSRLRHHLSLPMPLGAEQALLREVVSAVADIGAAPSLLATAARGLEASASARTSRLGSGAMPRLVAMIVLGPPGEDTQA
jgi:superfamily II DNA or RNA helicase